jgi:hypothetical protein
MQAPCCYSFTACGVEEYYYNKKTNKKARERIKLSPHDIYDNNVKFEEEDKAGKSVEDAFEWMKLHVAYSKNLASLEAPLVPLIHNERSFSE